MAKQTATTTKNVTCAGSTCKQKELTAPLWISCVTFSLKKYIHPFQLLSKIEVNNSTDVTTNIYVKFILQMKIHHPVTVMNLTCIQK